MTIPPASPNGLQPYLDWFAGFTAAYLQDGDSRVALKHRHTLQVLDNARRITASLSLAPELEFLTHLAALFHDVGRFPQYARFRTFDDRLAGNHGAGGVRVLRRTGALTGLAPGSRRTVLAAVGLHNRRALPPRLPADVDLAVRVVRDADKLDIFRVMLIHFSPDALHDEVVRLGLQPHPTRYSPEILARVQNRQLAEYAHMVWINDFKLLVCSWIYDFNFSVSYRLLRERGYLDRLLGYLPASPEFTDLGRRLREDLAAACLPEAGPAP